MTLGTRVIRQLRTGLFLLVVALLVSGYLAQDPFGLKSASEKLSEDWFQLWFGAPLYSSQADDLITVLLIDDLYMANRSHASGQHWPLPYHEQAQLLQAVLDGQPRAIFVDFLYHQQHAQGDSPVWLVNTMRNAQRAGIPVILPKLFGKAEQWHDCNDAQANGELGAADVIDLVGDFDQAGLPHAYLGTRNCGQRYPPFLGAQDGLAAPSPAMALYSLYCQQSGACPDPTIDAYAQPMVLQWRSRLPDAYQAAIDYWASHGFPTTTCQRISSCPLRQWEYGVAKAMNTFLYGLSGKLSDPERQWDIYERCPAITTVSAALLLNHQFDRARINALFKDRYVLIGSRVGLHPDVLDNPIHGSVAGVYQHAMALDNLMSLGSRYVKDMGEDQRLWLEALVLWALLWLRFRPGREGARYRRRRSGVLVDWAEALFWAALILGVANLVGDWFEQNTYDWLGLLVAAYLSVEAVSAMEPQVRRGVESAKKLWGER